MRWLALVALLLWPLVASADTVRLGIFIGNDTGLGEDAQLQYAEREAAEAADVFAEMGDMARERMQVLQGARAPDVREALRLAEAQTRDARAQGHDVLLVVYYSGHASRDGLHLTGTVLPMEELRRFLERSTAEVRVAFVDACESGTLVRDRGGKAVEPLDITVDDRLTMSGLVVVSSTGPLSVARESESFGGGVFSRALLNGLRGTADADSDGRITLDEAYRHALQETVRSTATSGAAIQTPEVRYAIQGVGDVVLTRLPKNAAALVLPEELEGVYSVVAVHNGSVVARVDKQAGEVKRISLPAGRYVVRKVRQDDVLLAELSLVWGGDRWVDDAQMTRVPLGDPQSRGGWTPRPLRVGVGAGLAGPIALANPWMGVAQADVLWLARDSVGLNGTLALASGARSEPLGRLVASTATVSLGPAWQVHRERVDVGLSAGPAVQLTRQSLGVVVDDGPSQRLQISAGLDTRATLHLPLSPGVGLQATLGVRALPQRQEVDRLVLTVQPSATVGLAWGRRARRLGEKAAADRW